MPTKKKSKRVINKDATEEQIKAAEEAVADIPEEEAWAKSKAKILLRDDILIGAVTDRMSANEIFHSRPEFMEYDYEKFYTNLRNLRESLEKDQKRMQRDCEFYGHDRALLVSLRATNPPRRDPEKSWHKSKARKSLKKDIDNGKHFQMKPSELYMQPDRPEYREFEPEEFRKHIHQEVDERAARLVRMQKKGYRPRPPQPTTVLVDIYN